MPIIPYMPLFWGIIAILYGAGCLIQKKFFPEGEE